MGLRVGTGRTKLSEDREAEKRGEPEKAGGRGSSSWNEGALGIGLLQAEKGAGGKDRWDPGTEVSW